MKTNEDGSIAYTGPEFHEKCFDEVYPKKEKLKKVYMSIKKENAHQHFEIFKLKEEIEKLKEQLHDKPSEELTTASLLSEASLRIRSQQKELEVLRDHLEAVRVDVIEFTNDFELSSSYQIAIAGLQKAGKIRDENANT